MPATVVILGGSFAGLHIAHALLKKNTKDLKVILVSKVSHIPVPTWNSRMHVQLT
jgi:apoptosis-inducing factor 2